MAPDPHRHRLLHGEAAGSQQARGVADAEAAGCRQRGIFAERMPGNERGIPAHRKTGLGSPARAGSASETAISAGWAFSVSCRVSAGPSQMMAVSFSPRAASTSSNTARAAGKASANALPMPTAWEPCPGNVNAAVMVPECPRKSLKFEPKDTAGAGCVKPPPGSRRPADASGRAAFPCHGAQNPYKPRHPWIPAGS